MPQARPLPSAHAHEVELTAGRQALAGWNWHEARERFEAALETAETAGGQEGLATALCWLGDIPAALRAYERAFVLYQQRRAPRDAARQAIFLALEYAGSLGENAVANGWLRRAHRLLDGLEPGPEHAWLALWEGHIAFLLHDDLETGRRRLAEGLALARSLELREVELFAVGMEGLTLVAEGQVRDGLERLDEAATAAASGELADIQAVGQAYCYMLRACELTQDFDRASQWLQVAREGSRRMRIDYRMSYCREHHAAILIWRGAFQEAEEELEAAASELEPVAPGPAPFRAARLGDLRRRQGRYDEAVALFARGEASPLASLGRAALALDQGNFGAAVELVERYFRRLPAGDRIQRVPGLAILVPAWCGLGELSRAGECVAELRSIAPGVGTEAIRATLSAGEGLLAAAAGDLEEAKVRLEEAVDRFGRTGSPFETGRTRLDLARVLHRLGNLGAAREELVLARAQLEEIGAHGEAQRVEAALRELGEEAAAGEPSAAPPDDRRKVHGLTPRQREVLRFVAEGLSNREIGERLFVSEFTVKRHIADILTRLDLPSRAAASAFAARNGLV